MMDHPDGGASTRAACSTRQTSAGLRGWVRCGGGGTLVAGCGTAGAWAREAQYNGTLAARSPTPAAACARAAFDAYLCGLPARAADDELRPADWAFGSDPPSVGKFVARYALQLYLGMSRPERPFRHVQPADFLREWRWRPPQRACPAMVDTDVGDGGAVEAWVRSDVCAGAPAAPPPPTGAAMARLRAGARLLHVARGNGSGAWGATADPLWMSVKGGGATDAAFSIAAQLVRRVRTHAVGPCTRARADALSRRALRRLLDGNDSGTGGGGGGGAGGAGGPGGAGGGGTTRHAGVERARAHGGGPRRLAIAVHIRRGDACEVWASGSEAHSEVQIEGDGARLASRLGRRLGRRRPPRPCFDAPAYLRAARRLLSQLGPMSAAADAQTAAPPLAPPWLLVASDSPSAASELAQAMDHPMEFEILQAGAPQQCAPPLPTARA